MPDLTSGGFSIPAQGNPVNVNPLQQMQGVVGTLGQLAQIRAIQANIAQTQQQIAKQGTENLAEDVASVVPGKSADDPDVVNERMRRAMAGLQSGRYGPMGQTIISQYAAQGGFTDRVAKELAIQSGNASLQEAQGMAPITPTAVGGVMRNYQVNPIQGTVGQIGPDTSIPMTQAEALTSVGPGVDLQGRPTIITRADLAGQAPGAIAPNAPPTPGQPAPTGAQPQPSGFTPSPYGHPVGPPAGTVETMQDVSKASGAMLTNDRLAAQATQSSMIPLQKVNELLQTPGGQTGPMTQAVNGWRDWMLANASWIANLPGMGGLNQETITAATQDQIKKYMTQIAGAAAAQYGEGTDRKLAIAASGNPNPDLSTLGNRDVTRMNIALARATQAKPIIWDATHGAMDTPGYGKWATHWATTTDPRAFMLDLLSPAERAQLGATIKAEGPQAMARFLNGKRAAIQAGFYSDASLPGR